MCDWRYVRREAHLHSPFQAHNASSPIYLSTKLLIETLGEVVQKLYCIVYLLNPKAVHRFSEGLKQQSKHIRPVLI